MYVKSTLTYVKSTFFFLPSQPAEPVHVYEHARRSLLSLPSRVPPVPPCGSCRGGWSGWQLYGEAMEEWKRRVGKSKGHHARLRTGERKVSAESGWAVPPHVTKSPEEIN